MEDPKDNSSVEQDVKILEKHVNGLLEHFDTVTILVTRQNGDTTCYRSRGAGNIFARYGQGVVWLESLAEELAGNHSPQQEDNDDEE